MPWNTLTLYRISFFSRQRRTHPSAESVAAARAVADQLDDASWLYWDTAGEQYGPFSLHTYLEWLTRGYLSPSTPVSRPFSFPKPPL